MSTTDLEYAPQEQSTHGLACLDTPQTGPTQLDSPLEMIPEGAGEQPEARSWYWRWIDNPWAVLAILVLVTGALGLPLLWQSRAFSTPAKWVIGVLITVATVAACYYAYLEISRSLSVILEALRTI